MSDEKQLESRLLEYLADLKKRRNKLDEAFEFCVKHNFEQEQRWIAKERDILCSEYVEIHNKVLGVYF